MCAVGYVVGGMTAAAPAHAFECTAARERCFVNLTWPDRVVPYVVRIPTQSAMPSALLEGAATRAFDRWTNVSCSDLEFVFTGVTRSDEPLADVNEVVTVDAGWTATGRDPRAAALTTVSFGDRTGTIFGARIEINDDGFDFIDLDGGGCVAEFDLEAVLTHEAGHMVGLAHPCEGAATDNFCPVTICDATTVEGELPTMWWNTPTCNDALRTLEADDVEGLCFLYPAGQPTRNCFALPDQDEPYVANQPFGCNTAPPGDGFALWGLGLLWLAHRARKMALGVARDTV